MRMQALMQECTRAYWVVLALGGSTDCRSMQESSLPPHTCMLLCEHECVFASLLVSIKTYWPLFCLQDLYHANKKQDRSALAKPLQNILQEVEGNPVVKTKVLHLCRWACCEESVLNS